MSRARFDSLESVGGRGGQAAGGEGRPVRLLDAALKGARDYWLEALDDLPAPAPPAGSLDRGATDGAPEPDAVEIRFDGALYRAMESVAQGSPFLVLTLVIVATELALARSTGRDRVSVGTPRYLGERSGRGLPGADGSSVVIVARSLSRRRPFREHLGQARRGLLEAYRHQDVPWEMLARALGLAPDAEPLSLCSLGVRMEGLHSRFPEPGSEDGRVPILELTPRDGAVVGILRFDGRHHRRTALVRFCRQVRAVLAAGLESPERPVGELSHWTGEERHQALVEWNDTPSPVLPFQTITGLFRERLDRQPDSVALVEQGRAWSYGALARKVDGLAARLRDQGVGPGSRVALAVDRSSRMTVAILGTLTAGAAYVPLDPGYPSERLELMLDDAEPTVVVSHDPVCDRIPSGTLPVIDLEAGAAPEDGPRGRRIPDGSRPGPRALVYVMYTSGSTGRPKGVLMDDRSLVNLVRWHVGEPRRLRGGRRLQFASPSFDGSFRELLSTLISGGTLILVPEELRTDVRGLVRRMDRERAEAILVPSVMLGRLAEEGVRRPESLRTLREVISAGEQLRVTPAVIRFFRDRPQCSLHNHYGPTETHVATAAALDPDPGVWPALPTIGRPIWNHRAYCVDPDLRPVPIDAVGELLLGGAGPGHGYHRRPALTAERFVPDPFSAEPGARVYRTGDLASWRTDGRLEFLGRADHQVKIRGFRVEPGEIEAVLGDHPDVREAVVVPWERTEHERTLVAYVVGRPGSGGDSPRLDAEALRAFLSDRLPAHMVPTLFVPLDALPLSPNRKVDRKALPDPAVSVEDEAAEEAPRSLTEQLVARIWEDVLGRSGVGRDTSFFALGGHSLLAIQVASRLEQALGVEVEVRRLFEATTVADLAAVVDETRSGRPAPPIERVDRTGRLPLSHAQERLWFQERLEPETGSYHLPFALELAGELDLAALAGALSDLRRRHEILGTTFPEADGVPRQSPGTSPDPGVPLVDLSGIEPARRRDLALRVVHAESARPFDLARGPLVRPAALRLEPRRHALLVVMHHMVGDGWSQSVFIPELLHLYRRRTENAAAPEAGLPELPFQYVDFAVWQRRRLEGEVLEEGLRAWRERLDGAQPLELPTDRPPGPSSGRRAGRVEAVLPEALAEGARSLAGARTATLYMVLFAAFLAVVHRLTGQTDLLVGSPSANRDRPELEGLIGFFVNMLALRVDCSGRPGFGELVERVRTAALEAYTHREVPFERVVEASRPHRRGGRAPLFPAIFSLQNAPRGSGEVPGLEVSPLATQTGGPKYDLTVAVAEEAAGGLGVGVEYDAALFDHTTVVRLVGHLERLLAAALERPERPLDELAMLTTAECHALIHEWARGPSPALPDRAIHDLVAERAAAHPETVAVTAGGETLRYSELEARANRLARRLRTLGIGSEDRVAVFLERSPALVVALLGILKAGGAYVPLDPASPPDRLAFMAQQADCSILVTRGSLRERVVPLEQQGLVVVDLEAEEPHSEELSPTPVQGSSHPDALAYVMYTSGSTGRPKGVAVPHRAVIRLVWQPDYVRLGPDERMAFLSNVSFDAATLEIWGALVHGGRLVVIDPETVLEPSRLASTLRAEGVTTLFLTTSLFHQVVRDLPDGFSSVRQVLFGGEAVDPRRLRDVLAAKPPGALINGYGPTENTTFTACHTVDRVADAATSVPIGRPIAGSRAEVLGPNGTLQPIGTAGELCAGGAGLARGYHGRPAETASRFVPDPATTQPGARLYRTGDRARWNPSGRIEYLGRFDDQVKIRGFRIEPGEVEAAIAAQPGVSDVVVQARDDEARGPRLVAYVIQSADTGPADLAELRDRLRRSLPEYMVPAAFVPMASFPLGPTGKVDRRALPEPDESVLVSGTEYVEPRSPTEEAVAAIFEEVLARERIGVHDDFFDLGGHSLMATQVVSRCRDAFGVELRLRELFDGPTVAGLAAALEERQIVGADEEDLESLMAELEGMSDEEAERLADEAGPEELDRRQGK